MGKSYRPYLPDQEFLLPPSLREWLPENHLIYFVSDVVDNLNLSALEAVYGDEQRGQPPYDPRMMTKVLVYGYCVGVFSSRRIERRLSEDVGFRVLAAGNLPNFRTIADFRKLHLATLAGLFEEVLKIALEAGALKLGRVALDGTKLKANASKHKAMSYGRMQERARQLCAEVRELLAQAEAADAAEDAHYGVARRGDELPAELQRRESRLKKIRAAQRALEERARQSAEKAGKPSAEVQSAQPADKDQDKFTDPESRLMQGSDGKPTGSRLIGQPFGNPGHFWGRPSATGPFPYNAGASSGSNLGPTNPALIDAVKARIQALTAADPDNKTPIPVDLVTASASGLDPHISPAAADYQINRVARARKIEPEKLRALVQSHTEARQWGLFGEPRVNVLALNLALDAMH